MGRLRSNHPQGSDRRDLASTRCWSEVLGAMLGVEDREGGNDAVGVSRSSKPLGNTTL
jgi:hypothetical protein